MSDDPHSETLSFEVSCVYVEVMQALEGASTAATRSALAMAVLMTGEHLGLTGQALIDWIDETGNNAKAALRLSHSSPQLQ